MIRAYLDTNVILCLALREDSVDPQTREAETESPTDWLLAEAEQGRIQLCIPSHAYAESGAVLRRRRIQFRELTDAMSATSTGAGEAFRMLSRSGLPGAQDEYAKLQELLPHLSRTLDEAAASLRSVIELLASRAETLFASDSAEIHSLLEGHTDSDDCIILQAIIEHARAANPHPVVTSSYFVTGDAKLRTFARPLLEPLSVDALGDARALRARVGSR